MIVAVYADGGCITRNPSLLGGTWAYCHVDESSRRVCEVGGLLPPAEAGTVLVSNNQSEFYALLMALEALPDGWSGTAYSDSFVTLTRFFHRGKLANIRDDWRRRMALVLGRLGPITPVLLDGHPTRVQLAAGVGKRGHPVSEHNVWCDQECARQAKRAVAPAWSVA